MSFWEETALCPQKEDGGRDTQNRIFEVIRSGWRLNLGTPKISSLKRLTLHDDAVTSSVTNLLLQLRP